MSHHNFTTRRTRMPGIYVAALTAVVSGVSVFVNSYGVRRVSSPLLYTTSKNIVAAVILVAAWGWGARAIGRRTPSLSPEGAHAHATSGRRGPRATRLHRTLGLGYVGVVGGGLAFVLFFNGLARSQPASAAFWRDTLVPEVALLAVFFLKERLTWWNLVALALLVAGEILATGGVGHLGARPGEIEIVASSGLWAFEVIIAKALLRDTAPAAVAAVRMSVGAAALMAYLATSGRIGALFTLTAHQLWWIAATGVLLALYVATWMIALSRARALDVTSILVGAAVVTWALQEIAGGASNAPAVLGLALIGTGTLLTLVAAATRRPGYRWALGPRS